MSTPVADKLPIIDMLAEVPEGPEDQQARLPVVAAPAEAAPEIGGPLGAALQALKMGMSVADMKDVLVIQKDWEANEARKAFADAMATFKLNPPEVLKDAHVHYVGAKGVVDYDHASIGEVCEKVTVAAAAHGFSHRWQPTPPVTPGHIAITCVITHRMGHVETTTLEGPRDDSGGKNAIQGVGSSSTYLSRYTLLLGYGFATRAIKDPDGRIDPLRPEGGADVYDPALNLRYWNDLAMRAKTLEELNAVRKKAGSDFDQAKDLPGWEAHKVLVDQCRVSLSRTAAKKSSSKA